MPKASSVDKDGKPDGFVPGTFYKREVIPGGFTRVVVSAPSEALERVMVGLVPLLRAPLRLLYVRLTDRQKGQLPAPERHLAIEVEPALFIDALARFRLLFFGDGRHQLWVKEQGGAQLVLEELGVLYVYPDDALFREKLEALGVPEGQGKTLADRDYVRVEFQADADREELALLSRFSFRPWAGR